MTVRMRQFLDVIHFGRAKTASFGAAPTVKREAADTALEQVGARETLNAMPNGTYVTDNHRKILFWSDAAAGITGWPAEEVVGRSCADRILIHVDVGGHSLCGGLDCPLHKALTAGEASRQPLLLFAQHKQGHRIPVEVSAAPLCDRTGRRVGAVEVFRDLTRAIQELRRAKIIQDYLLRWAVPPDDRVRFAVRSRPEELVGGDFHRVQAIDNDHYAVMVADVMGHGLISALYTVHLRSAWDECQPELSSPARFLDHLNRRLHRLAGPEGYFATAVCLVLDAASGQLRYVRAGHPAPLVFHRTGQVEYLRGHSPALGLLESATYREGELELKAADQLLLCTDGAIELTNQRGEDLGDAGFLQLLQSIRGATLDLELVERKLLEFMHPASLPDDLTLLSIQFLHGGQAAPSSSPGE